MSSFTSGPWFAKGRYIGTKNHMSAIGECRDVNGNWSDDAKSSGDAHLIAAAPTMLEALQECEEYFDNRADADCDQDGFIPNEEMKLLAVVRDALRKAGVA
ncbi:hypothetical protein [Rhizobium leguminosarum]